MGVILDSNFYLGLIHPHDTHSERADELLVELKTGKYGLLFTTNLIIAEVATLVSIRTKGNKDILQDLQDLIWGENKIATRIEVSNLLEKESWERFKKINSFKQGKKGFLSFVDTSIIVIAKNKSIEYLVSFDEHFDGLIARIY
jgi:predicted nucleic acid-binding protein